MKRKVLVVAIFSLVIFSLMKLMCIIISGLVMYSGCSFKYFLSKSYIDVIILLMSLVLIGGIFKNIDKIN